MRPIDADALIVSECSQCDGDCHEFDGRKCLKYCSHNKCQLREAIDYADTIDAVPVVRCKDCRWYDSAFSACDKYSYCVSEDFYCAHGEREA